jgi:glycine/D-amino acid oxidase-like deaminating enzyme
MTSSALTPLDLSPSRLRESIVGLRPYRPSGFVVRAEALGAKALVHNYGHGGCGVTLSWGTARLAVEAAGPARGRSAAVIGAGAVGLATAAALTDAGWAVAVYAEHVSPDTTSDIAPALWGPTTLYDPARVDEDFLARFREASRTSFEAFRAVEGRPGSGVRWMRKISVGIEVPGVAAVIGEDLYPNLRSEPEVARRLGAPAACSFDALMADTDVFLPGLAKLLGDKGVRLERRRFASRAEVEALEEEAVFNCAGLGAGALFGDREILPVRGQITRVAPQPGLDYGYAWERADGILYMYPRASGIVLGGTMGYGEASRAVDEGQRAWMLAQHAEIAGKLAGCRLSLPSA